MAGLFGKKKHAGKTVAIADIENGSVAAALVRLIPGEAPRLFAEKRVSLPFSPRAMRSIWPAKRIMPLKRRLRI